jgi:MarR family transcriptional regulator for hemolysin
LATDENAYLLRDLTRDLVLSGRLWRKLARQAAARHGVSEAAASPLVWLERLGDSVRQNALAEAVGIEGASLVRLLDELATSGLVTRTPDPADRRANLVSLTEDGRRTVAEVIADLEALRAEIFAGLHTGDTDAARRIFAAIKSAAAGVTPDKE